MPFPSFRTIALLSLLIFIGCGPEPRSLQTSPAIDEWQEFQGTWTAAGSRHVMALGTDRRASISDLTGSLMLVGPSRPAVGFRAEAIVFNDSLTGMVGRAVWTDERGEQAFSELKGEGTATSNKILGTFVGGTGRYAGVSGTYEFSWRFLLETEDGTVQGQSLGFHGRVHIASLQTTPRAAGPGS